MRLPFLNSLSWLHPATQKEYEPDDLCITVHCVSCISCDCFCGTLLRLQVFLSDSGQGLGLYISYFQCIASLKGQKGAQGCLESRDIQENKSSLCCAMFSSLSGSAPLGSRGTPLSLPFLGKCQEMGEIRLVLSLRYSLERKDELSGPGDWRGSG